MRIWRIYGNQLAVQHEQYGIILEDDCIAQETFFPFMQELLIKYEKDERIGMIDGANYIKRSSYRPFLLLFKI